MDKNYMFLYGKNAVLERLKVNPRSIKKVFLLQGYDTEPMLNLIHGLKVPFVNLPPKEFMKMKRADRVQGVIAQVDKFTYTSFRDLLNRPKGQQLSLIFLDEINDPQNLGVIIRSAACFGNFAVVIPKHGACEINDTVLHVASGGENFVPVALVTNLTQALIEAKKAGYWAIGAVVEGGEDINKISIPYPVCLVMGSEGRGVRKGLLDQLELKVSLPMRGAVLSFNVAIACALLCQEIVKQRPKDIL
jgi:23S rRNA (guanosine2251-2'-O)-methyltransferase